MTKLRTISDPPNAEDRLQALTSALHDAVDQGRDFVQAVLVVRDAARDLLGRAR